MYIGEFNLNDWVTIPVQVHNMEGHAANIDAGPFEINFYQSDPTLIGAPEPMNTPDVAFSTVLDEKPGFYYAQVQLSRANGFAIGRQYFARIGAAIVDGVKPAAIIAFGIRTPFGAGARTVDLTVLSAGTPVPGASVIVRNADGTLIVTGGNTNSSGNLSLLLDDGSYNVWLTKAGYSFANPATLSVDGDETVEYTMSPVPSGTPQVGLQQLYGNVVTVSGEAAVGAEVVAEIVNYPQSADGSIISSQECEGSVDVDGNFTLSLVKGARAKLTIREPGSKPFFQKVFTVSSDDTKDILSY